MLKINYLKAETSKVSLSAYAYKCQYKIWFLEMIFKKLLITDTYN